MKQIDHIEQLTKIIPKQMDGLAQATQEALKAFASEIDSHYHAITKINDLLTSLNSQISTITQQHNLIVNEIEKIKASIGSKSTQDDLDFLD